jgi:simple sugar transport system permease protein
MSWILSDAFLFAVVLQSSSLVLAGLGGLFGQQANVLNIALDGMMLMGAFAAIAAGAATQNAGIAVAAAAAAGVAISIIFGLISLFMAADFIVVGIGIGTLTTGLSVLMLSTMYGSEGSFVPLTYPDLYKVDLGPLRRIPILGPALDGQTILVFLAILLIPICQFVLYRTRFGLRVRAVGEDEAAAVAAGLGPRSIKFATVIISGVLCGIAGAQLAMATLGQFVTGMTAGRGFIALAAIFVGRARPVGTVIGCVLFGLVGAAANELQLMHVPSDLMFMLPYAVTVAVLMIQPITQRIKRARRPRKSPPADKLTAQF